MEPTEDDRNRAALDFSNRWPGSEPWKVELRHRLRQGFRAGWDAATEHEAKKGTP